MFYLFREKIKILSTIFIAISMVILSVVIANAGVLDGDVGDGYTPAPLELVGAYLSKIEANSSTTSNPIIGNKKVPVKPIIKLVFSSNVVNDVIWEYNQTCISMKDAVGNSIDIRVQMIPDEGENGNSNESKNIFLTPLKELTIGNTYNINIKSSLMDKNLASLIDSQNISFTVKNDNTAPVLKVRSLKNNLRTNKRKIFVSGNTEIGATVKINRIQKSVDSKGVFSSYINLAPGTNIITINSTDDSENTSTLAYKVYYDNLPPSLKILSPSNNMKSKKKTITIKGVAEKGSVVKVNGRVITNKYGSFSKVISLKKGSNTIIITATDTSANIKKYILKVRRV